MRKGPMKFAWSKTKKAGQEPMCKMLTSQPTSLCGNEGFFCRITARLLGYLIDRVDVRRVNSKGHV